MLHRDSGGLPVIPHRPRVLVALGLAAFLAGGLGRPGGASNLRAEGNTPATGRLAGTVEVGPDLSTHRIRFNLYPGTAGRPEPAGPSPSPHAELKNVVIHFEEVDAPGARPGARREAPVMLQEEFRFVPHVLAIEKGSTVSFPNGDPVFHNVFSLSRSASFDLGRYPQGESKSVRFDKPGIVKVFCHLHSHMNGIIMVLDNPWFAVPDESGRYEIDGVPPGTYTVTAWHERVRPLSTRVTIEPNGTTVLDLRIPLSEALGG